MEEHIMINALRQTKSLSLFLVLVCIPFLGYSQAKLSATASSGSAYSTINAAGWEYEDPDCIHTSFGAHVTMASDATLGKNVFVFHSHITADNDRCENTDRVRMEIKGGYTDILGHTNGTTAYYRWKFKLDANFIGSSSFCHIFQIKGYGGDDTGAPLITITPRATTLEVIHDGGDEAGSVDLGVLKSVSLSGFKGEWVEAYIKFKSSDDGSFEITLTRIRDKAVLLSYSKTSGIDLWRTGSERTQGKWGVYRKKATGLRDEQVRFADFCVSESSASQCPSSIVSSYNNIAIEAESGTITSPMAVQSDAAASGGKYIMAPSGTNSSISAPSSGYSTISFTAAGGNYKMWFKTIMASTSTNSFWYRIDGGTWVSWNVDADVSTTWKWNSVASLTLAAGSHTLTIAYREGGSKLDRIAISNDPAYDPAVTLKSVSDEVSVPQSDLQLKVSPNPLSGSNAQISYNLPAPAKVKIVVYSITGQVVATVEEAKEAGQCSTDIDVSKLSSATYIVWLIADGAVAKDKLIISR
jgi:hypothetical protein